MKQNAWWIGILGILLSGLVGGCASQAYEQAQKTGTVVAYDQFLKDYGQSEYASSAKKSVRKPTIRTPKDRIRRTVIGTT
ncbi:hypothetical protein WDW89_19160 [Deltaproteobacteria bacterium TL4]